MYPLRSLLRFRYTPSFFPSYSNSYSHSSFNYQSPSFNNRMHLHTLNKDDQNSSLNLSKCNTYNSINSEEAYNYNDNYNDIDDSLSDSSSNTSFSISISNDNDSLIPEKESSLESLLDLIQISNDTFTNKSELFIPYRGRGLFGGTMAAQSILASLYYSNSLENTWKPISIHCHFLHAAQPTPNLYYKVIPLKSSKNYSTVEVELSQNDRLIFKAMVSLQSINLKGSASNMNGQLFHNPIAPIIGKDIDHPDNMLSQGELFKVWSKKAMNKPHLQYLKGQNCEDEVIKCYNREPFIWKLPNDMFNQDLISNEERDKLTSDRVLRYWIKSKDKLKNPSIFNYVAIAYISDYFFLSANMRLNLHEMFTTKFSVSLDHTIYFNNQIDTFEYFNYNIKNLKAGENRSIMYGEIFSYDGQLAATAIQEGLSVIYTD